MARMLLLTIHGVDVIGEMSCSCCCCCSRCCTTLHQQVTVGASLTGTGHQVVVLCGVGPRWRRGETKQGTVLQVFMGHWSRKKEMRENRLTFSSWNRHQSNKASVSSCPIKQYFRINQSGDKFYQNFHNNHVKWCETHFDKSEGQSKIHFDFIFL